MNRAPIDLNHPESPDGCRPEIDPSPLLRVVETDAGPAAWRHLPGLAPAWRERLRGAANTR